MFNRIVFSVLLICLSAFYVNTFAQNALSFDGSDDYVQTTLVGPTGTSSRTVEVWINTVFQTSQEVIVDYGTYSTGARFTLALINGRVRVEVYGSGVTGSTVVADTSWHHIAVTFNNSLSPKYRTYIDGKISDSFDISTAINTGSNVKVRFGLRVDDVNPFTGQMDEIRIWDYDRNRRQIANNYNVESCGRQKGLIGYHKFNQGVAGKNNAKITSSTDLSGRKNNGALKNFSLNGSTSNWVQGFQFPVQSVSGSTTISSCGSYKSPSGKYIWKSSGKYIDTIPNYLGCDSILTINLTVVPNPTKTINAKSCKAYLSPSGYYVWTKSGTYSDVLPNPKGCDTLVTIHLVVSAKSIDTARVSACDFYISPSGKKRTTTGIYNDTLVSCYGCDSIIVTKFTRLSDEATWKLSACDSLVSPSGRYVWRTSGVYFDTILNSNNCNTYLTIELKVMNTTFGTLEVFQCDSFYTPSGNYLLTESMVFSDTIPNRAGCDSVIRISFTKAAGIFSMNQTTCNSYISPSKKYEWTVDGEYFDTVQTSAGCDSILRINLKVLSSAATNVDLKGCNTLVSPSGKYEWTQSGTYMDTVLRTNGCDSILHINLEMTNLKAEVEFYKLKYLRTTTVGDHYQWLDCDNGMAKIESATDTIYTPSNFGMFAVEVTKDDCIDTSACIKFSVIGVEEAVDLQVTFYPNPTDGLLNVQVHELEDNMTLDICDINGRVISHYTGIVTGNNQIVLPEQPGIYLIKLIGSSKQAVHRVVRTATVNP